LRHPGTVADRIDGEGSVHYRDAIMKTFENVGPELLRALPHSGGAIELKHKAPEVTFLGVNDQPDFATLYITMYPRRAVIELKSLKEYLFEWRDAVVSYERFLDVVFQHLMGVYEPVRLRLTLETRPRGGISSKLTIDSDWGIRGGKEEFRDWMGMEDTW
jgi:7-cyano-7-deazaguanine reductase